MNERVRLHTANSIQIVENRVILHNPHATLSLNGDQICNLARSVVPLLDGTRTSEEAAAQLRPRFGDSAVEFLAFLDRFGLLQREISDSASVSSQLRLLSLLRIPVDTGMQRLANAR